MPLLANVWCCCEHTETREPIDENVSYFSAPILSMVWSALYLFRLPSSFFSMHSFSHRYNEFGAIEWDSNTTLIRYSKVSVLKTCSAKFQSAPTFVPICYCIHHHNVKFQGIQLFCIDIYIYTFQPICCMCVKLPCGFRKLVYTTLGLWIIDLATSHSRLNGTQQSDSICQLHWKSAYGYFLII